MQTDAVAQTGGSHRSWCAQIHFGSRSGQGLCSLFLASFNLPKRSRRLHRRTGVATTPSCRLQHLTAASKLWSCSLLRRSPVSSAVNCSLHQHLGVSTESRCRLRHYPGATTESRCSLQNHPDASELGRNCEFPKEYADFGCGRMRLPRRAAASAPGKPKSMDPAPVGYFYPFPTASHLAMSSLKVSRTEPRASMLCLKLPQTGREPRCSV